MWSFLSKQLKRNNSDTQKSKRPNRPLQFAELISLMGDISDLAKNDVAFKFWIPEPVEKALFELSERSSISNSESLRTFLFIHCYGLYAFHTLLDAHPGAVKWDPDTIKYSKSGDSETGKRITTYWVAELGKNVAPIKVWIPARLRRDLDTLARHVDLTPSQYVREILISRLFGHGMLPKRPEMFEAYPTEDAENWCTGKEFNWREVKSDELKKYHSNAKEIRTVYIDDEKDDTGVS